jgi:helicase
MKIDYISENYQILKKVVDRIKQYDKLDELFPPQEEAIKKGVLDGENLILCTGTGSGKTLIGELAALKCILETGKKVMYLVPLRALAMEKYYDFKLKYEPLGIKVALSIGDMDSSDAWIERYQLVCCTYEKADSLIRHGAPWLNNVGVLVIDETHDLNLIDRGPTLEIVITRLLKENPNIQVIGLSATIGNPKDLAKWLNSKLVVSDFRPIPLYEGVYYDGKIYFGKKGEYEPVGEADDPELRISEDVIRTGGQSLIFVNTRKEAEAVAKKAGTIIQKFITPILKNELKKVSKEVLNALEIPTKQCRELANCILHGVSYHHAGLLNSQKKAIEDAYRKGVIKLIVATPTLIAGVNLPSQTVIIRNVRRYNGSTGGIEMWPVSLYKQAVGRAGRIKFDKEGRSVLIARSEDEATDMWDYYIKGEVENITSKLAVEPILRMHTLALVASEFCKSDETLLNFFSKTFYAFQYGDISLIEERILDILDKLVEWKFIINRKGKLIATRIGKRVSELYIDPLTAHYFIESLDRAVKKKTSDFGFLQMISNTIEMKPLLALRTGEFSEISKILTEREGLILQDIPEEWDLDFDEFLKSVKTALFLEYWINEATEDQILMKYRVTPGELRGRLEIADWLMYSTQELALLLGYKDLLKNIRKLRVRLKYGIKEELISLVRLRDVGRIRARRLFSAGLTSLQKIRETPVEKLSAIVGPRIAKSIIDQLSGKTTKENVDRQITLNKF